MHNINMIMSAETQIKKPQLQDRLQLRAFVLRGYPGLVRDSFPRLESLKERQRTEVARHGGAKDVVGVLGVFRVNFDGLSAATRGSGVGEELHLTALLQSDVEVQSRLDGLPSDQNAVIL